ncbi:MAG: AsmA family protein [Bacteroidetes bacterium]|nr:AsmA family protein [Bacteroidota bacterium]
MKKIFKLFTWLVVIFITLIIVLLVTAKLAENKIADIALKKVSENIEAPVSIDEVSFNLLRKFPYATIELYGVTIDSPKKNVLQDSFGNESKSILRLEKLYVSVKSKPLLKSKFEIMKIDVKGAQLNYKVDTAGRTNIDFLLATEEDTTAVDTIPSDPLSVILDDLSAWDIEVNYNDESLKTKAKVKIPELKVNAEIQGDAILASVVGKINLTNCSFNETNLYLMENTDVQFDIDYETDSVCIKQLSVDTDGAGFSMFGSVILGDEIRTNLQFAGTELDLDELIKYAPKEILTEYGIDRVKGKVNLNATAKGTYSEAELPQVNLNIDFKDGNIKTKDYPELKNISFTGKATNGLLRSNQSTQADFSTLHFETEKSKFDISFSILDIDKPKYVINTLLDIDVGEFKHFIPDTLLTNIDGKIRAELSTKGELPDSIGDNFIDQVMANSSANLTLSDFDIDVDKTLKIENFSTNIIYKPNILIVKDFNVEVPAYDLELKNTSINSSFRGSINNTSNMQVDLKSYHLETKGAVVTGNAKVKNLDNPNYEFESKIVTDLKQAKVMLPDSLLKTLDGNIVLNVKSKATLYMDSLSTQYLDIVFKNSEFNMILEDISAEYFDEPLYTIERFNGIINMTPDGVTIQKMRGVAAGVDFAIDSTEIWNTYEALVLGRENEKVTVQTNIALGEITNELLSAFMTTDTDEKEESGVSQQSGARTREEVAEKKSEMQDTTVVPLLPNLQEYGVPHFLVRGKLSVDKIEYEKNILDDISLKFRFADSLYVIDEFKLKTCGGEINTSVLLNARGRFWEKPTIDIRNFITALDVKELLMRNDNFGDTSLTYEKVNGILTSEMHLRVFYENGDWPTDRMRAEGHFTLEDGHIYDYEPLVDMSKSVGSIVAGGLKELDKLDFNTLQTSLFMYKDKIYVPKTDVVTSSMDFSAFAMHGLDGEYEYHLKLHLGDVLTGKSEKLMKEQAKQNKKDGGTVERNGIKLVSMKNDGKKKNGFDNEKLEKQFLKDLNKQQGWLRLLFNPLLVNFSTDLDRTKRNQEIIEKYGTKNTEE